MPNFINFIFIKILFIFSCLISIAVADPLPTATPESVGFSSEKLKRIDTIFELGISERRIPGAVIAIARRGKLVFFKAYGMQDDSKGIQMKKDSIFRIYSMTKPIVSVGSMILHENAKMYLTEPVGKYIPELVHMKVAKTVKDSVTNSDNIKIVDANSSIRIHDLLRHTAGFTYAFYGNSPARNKLKESGIGSLNFRDVNLEDYIFKLSKLPLAYQPGIHWEYGRSTDVLGYLIEVISENSLDHFLKQNIFDQLDMVDTGFWVPEEKWSRIAEPFKDKGEPKLLDVTIKPNLFSGGHGLVSTVGDYVRFCQMMLNEGILKGKRVLSPKTVQYMTSDHLGKHISREGPYYLPGPGYGFGLGFGVRENNGISAWPGSEGEYFWGGYAGTYFWIDPKEDLVVVSMTQSVLERVHYRMVLRNLVYQAFID